MKDKIIENKKKKKKPSTKVPFILLTCSVHAVINFSLNLYTSRQRKYGVGFICCNLITFSLQYYITNVLPFLIGKSE